MTDAAFTETSDKDRDEDAAYAEWAASHKWAEPVEPKPVWTTLWYPKPSVPQPQPLAA